MGTVISLNMSLLGYEIFEGRPCVLQTDVSETPRKAQGSWQVHWVLNGQTWAPRRAKGRTKDKRSF